MSSDPLSHARAWHNELQEHRDRPDRTYIAAVGCVTEVALAFGWKGNGLSKALDFLLEEGYVAAQAEWLLRRFAEVAGAGFTREERNAVSWCAADAVFISAVAVVRAREIEAARPKPEPPKEYPSVRAKVSGSYTAPVFPIEEE